MDLWKTVVRTGFVISCCNQSSYAYFVTDFTTTQDKTHHLQSVIFQPPVELNNQLFISIETGRSWTSTNRSQTFYVQLEIEKTYAAKTQTNTLINGELFLGLQYYFHPHLKAQIGLKNGLVSEGQLQGDIWEGDDLTFNNYDYQYRIKHYFLRHKLNQIFTKNWFRYPYLVSSISSMEPSYKV